MSDKRRSGFTMLEMMVLVIILVISLTAFLSVVVTGMGAMTMTREATLATFAARSKIEELKAGTFDEIFARYNSTTGDDLSGSNPGSSFTIEGLKAVEGASTTGLIEFPELSSDATKVDENYSDSDWGLPADLDGSGGIVTTGITVYEVLPVRVTATWRSGKGVQSITLQTWLSGD